MVRGAGQGQVKHDDACGEWLGNVCERAPTPKPSPLTSSLGPQTFSPRPSSPNSLVGDRLGEICEEARVRRLQQHDHRGASCGMSCGRLRL